MATISKFYLLDATSPNTGTMPSGDFLLATHLGTGSDATGFGTARDATDTAGASNPDIDATGTAAADTNAQRLCLRRFVSRPLAAFTTSLTDNWTFSYAAGESNTNHSGVIHCRMYLWRPSTGARVGTASTNFSTSVTATAETAYSKTTVGGTWLAADTTQDGDIIVFEVGDEFTQGMSTAYTTFFSYNGTTEASTTTCASFVSTPTPLTLFTPSTFIARPTMEQLQAVNTSAVY